MVNSQDINLSTIMGALVLIMKRKAVMKAKRYIDVLVARNASPRRVKRAVARYNCRIEVRDRLNLVAKREEKMTKLSEKCL